MIFSKAKITPALLMAMGTKSENAKLYAPLLEDARLVPGDGFNSITSTKGIAMFVAQIANESGCFSRISENLNYSVKALKEGEPSPHFSVVQAETYGRLEDSAGRVVRPANERMIANLYYGDRMGNKGSDTNDGWTFRGAGLIQLTGRSNFTLFGKTLGLSAEQATDYCRTPKGAVASAYWYWRSNGILVSASLGDVERVTRIINGGTIGLEHRKTLYGLALATLV